MEGAECHRQLQFMLRSDDRVIPMRYTYLHATELLRSSVIALNMLSKSPAVKWCLPEGFEEVMISARLFSAALPISRHPKALFEHISTSRSLKPPRLWSGPVLLRVADLWQ